MKIHLKPIPEKTQIEKLANVLNINGFLATLLLQREINTFEEAKAFFRPDIKLLHDPFLMKDMDKAIDRIKTAIEKKQKVLIYGDYDVDGTTAVAMVYDFLNKHFAYTEFYVPDRYVEGYGISTVGIEYAHNNGFELIISLDCGIKSVDKVDYANRLGVDFIICDHHEPGEEIPKANAVLDPKRKDCNYPFKELSGCGVGFKLLQAFCIINHLEINSLYQYLDLLCTSIGADIVPIIGENRIFCYHGLKKINDNPSLGIQTLIGISGFKKKLNITNVVFGIAPKINAAGRINHANAAVKLLLSKTQSEADNWANDLNDSNLFRKELDKSITSEAIEMIENQENFENLRSTVLFKKDWNKGVVGIVASRCIENYYRPTVILTESNGKAAGSARSVHGFDLYNAISNCSHHLIQFGGHTHAAGMTLEIDKIDDFRNSFEKIVSETISEDSLEPRIDVDLEVPLGFATTKVLKIIQEMAPFGPQNMTPIFISNNIIDGGNSRIVGGEHLKLDLFCQETKIRIDGIAFGQASKLAKIQSKNPFSICYSIEDNTYNGITTVQLNVRAIFESGTKVGK